LLHDLPFLAAAIARHEEQAGHALAAQQPDIREVLGRTAVGVAEQDRVPVAMGHVLGPTHDARPIRVCDARDEDTDGQAALAALAAGQPIGMIVELGDGALHAPAGRLGNARLVIDNGGHGLDRDADGPRHVRHRRHRARSTSVLTTRE